MKYPFTCAVASLLACTGLLLTHLVESNNVYSRGEIDCVCMHADTETETVEGPGGQARPEGGGGREGGKYCQMRGATAERQGFPSASGAHLYCAGDAWMTTGRDWDVVACH